jgi:hypothetical protein
MRARLIIVEGADNCGKSTLARAIAKRLRCPYWRLTSGPGLSEHAAMRLYQLNALDNAAVNISHGLPVVLDRHWVSDVVYGTILRGEPSTDPLVMETRCEELDAVYIHCQRHDAIAHHAKNKDPDHPYDDDIYARVYASYVHMFRQLDQWHEVIGYQLDNFIDRPNQLTAFIEGFEARYL